MIHLVRNGRRESVAAEAEQKLDALLARELAPDEVAVRVAIGARTLSSEELERPESVPIADDAEVHLDVRSVGEVARSALASAADYASKVSASLARAGAMLRAGDVTAGAELLADSSDALSILMFTLGGAAPHVGPLGATLEDATAELEPWLEELVQAQEAGDWNRAADSLEYELAPRIRSWSALCGAAGAARDGAAEEEGPHGH